MLAGWDDWLLDFTVPTMARYRNDEKARGRKIGDLILSQIRHGPGKVRSVLLMPEFVPGGTVREME